MEGGGNAEEVRVGLIAKGVGEIVGVTSIFQRKNTRLELLFSKGVKASDIVVIYPYATYEKPNSEIARSKRPMELV